MAFLNMGIKLSLREPSTTSDSKAIGQTTANASHTHSCTTTTDTASNIPPYIEATFAQRNDPAVSTSLWRVFILKPDTMLT
jgi:hypothetical protein